MHKILLIGPLPSPITGNSLANEVVYKEFTAHDQYHCDTINTSYPDLERVGELSIKKLLFYSSLYIYLFKIFFAKTVYITPGQTFFGVVKYTPFIYLAKLLRRQIIIHIHGNYLHQEYAKVSPWKKKIMYHIISKADKGIVLSKALRNNLDPFLPNKNIYLLNNFVENYLFTEKKSAEKYHTEHLRILYLSNLLPEKGIFDLLESLIILKEKNIKFKAKIAGGISKQNQLKFDGFLEKLSNHVSYLGVITGDKKREAFYDSNAFVLPTKLPVEGQPIAILEAMATGNIVLTTNHGGICDIFIDGQNGYFVKKANPENIADTFIKMSKNLPQLKEIMRHNMALARQEYTVNKFFNNLLEIINK